MEYLLKHICPLMNVCIGLFNKHLVGLNEGSIPRGDEIREIRPLTKNNLSLGLGTSMAPILDIWVPFWLPMSLLEYYENVQLVGH